MTDSGQGTDTRTRRQIGVWVVCAVLIVAAVVINQAAVHWRQNVADSHLFAYYGWCVSQGARPYLDVWDNKPPGIWWLNAAGFGLFGEGIGGELLICSLALALSLAAFVGIARTVYGRSMTLPAAAVGAVLLTCLVYECGANRTETFVVACESVAVLGYLRWRVGWAPPPNDARSPLPITGNRGLAWLGLSGLAAGAAPLFKQSGLAVTAACGLHLFGTMAIRRRFQLPPLLVAGAAFAIVPACAGLELASQGALGEAWYAVGRFNRAYFAIGDATWLDLPRAIGIYWEVLAPLAWLLAAAGVGLVWAAWDRWRARTRATKEPGLSGEPPARSGVELLWLWFVLAAYLACVGPGRRGHHFMPVLPSLGLLALYLPGKFIGHGDLVTRLAARPSSIGLLMIYAYVLVQLVVVDAPELSRCWAQTPHWYSLSYTRPPDWQLQGDEIRRLTQPTDRIYVWGWSPGTYRCAYRLPASRFATFEKLGQLGEQVRFIFHAAIADLQRNPPRVLMFSESDLRGVMAERGDVFGAWVAEHYADRGLVGGMHLLLRRD